MLALVDMAPSRVQSGYSRGSRTHYAPRATYRIQLTPDFSFRDAAKIVPYLADLGVSDLYLSPCLQAEPGSTHGYDVTDPTRLNEELGGRAGFDELVAATRDTGLGIALDIVPNHMSVAGTCNPWWQDVLEHGVHSAYWPFFDLRPSTGNGWPQLDLPVLGDHLAHALAAGDIQLKRVENAFRAVYFDKWWPLALPTMSAPLGFAAARCDSRDLRNIAFALGELEMTARDSGVDPDHYRRTVVSLYERMGRMLETQPDIAQEIDGELAEINRDSRRIGAVLDRQFYRLRFWRSAADRIGYRRFFDINELIGVRVEDPAVFTATHQLLATLVAEGAVTGLRVDHPDGLRDPAVYLDRLRSLAPNAWIVVEKILQPHESLRPEWPVDGTTGYDFLRLATGLFVDPEGERPLSALYRQFTGENRDFAVVARDAKREVLRFDLGADLRVLAERLHQVTESRRYDFSTGQIEEALVEVLAAFPVYRTYARNREVAQADAADVKSAIESVRAGDSTVDATLLELLQDVLLLRENGDQVAEFVALFQQVASPAMAKGVEDTAFYRYNRLVALNEVGGDPGQFSVGPDAFHEWCALTLESHPDTMLASTTHDTKRSEDARIRIAALSEMPEVWAAAVDRWSAHNARYRVNGMPSRNAEYLLYQTLVGAWPISTDRALAYMEKAVREAKLYTSWTRPAPEYDIALRDFVHACLTDWDFTTDVAAFVEPLAPVAHRVSLAQTLIRLTAPGVPDFYQGTELWDLSLVDPDNRRPVDFAHRASLLDEIATLTPEQIVDRIDDGLPMIWLIQKMLQFRTGHPELFRRGSYAPVHANGPKRDHIVAFLRDGTALTVAPRWLVRLAGQWGDTSLTLPNGSWIDLFTQDRFQGPTRVADLVSRFPVAFLVREESGP